MYTQILEACYYGQMKDYNYEKLRGKLGPHWTNYEYEMMNPKIDFFENSAVVTFQLKQTGMIVDNYSFRGQHVSMLSRATFVLIKSAKWKIAHIHLSKISD